MYNKDILVPQIHILGLSGMRHRQMMSIAGVHIYAE
jgi:hypothetical protein